MQDRREFCSDLIKHQSKNLIHLHGQIETRGWESGNQKRKQTSFMDSSLTTFKRNTKLIFSYDTFYKTLDINYNYPFTTEKRQSSNNNFIDWKISIDVKAGKKEQSSNISYLKTKLFDFIFYLFRLEINICTIDLDY